MLSSTIKIVLKSLPWNLDSNMTQQYLMVKARNLVTGQTVKNQDLTGARIELRQRTIAEDQADQLAVKMTARTGQEWQGFVEVYTPTSRS
jgi:hypothetical protein